MATSSRDLLLWGAGIGATAFVGYALYFDYRRTHAPDYKDSIRQKRKAAASRQRDEPFNLPNMGDAAAVQNFFLQEIQIGEELIAQGLEDEGIKHLCNAVVLCGQPDHLINIFRQTMAEHFDRIVAELPHAQARVQAAVIAQRGGIRAESEERGAIVDADDLE
ncbi:unnamed protein product [Bursaphelenchus xylophilus]|uniref:(pine wood nematode) hypothetical protein n=1 Tax=Bursaphelenchus xylophilus TaxID=6326 RepID=A0A1I7S0X8_BURXY|nr:unnamed protein product [Bursaphelenchus xylophilus]CAG9087860.1 unnamed protein product [Bursaphelenchus xylophilus]